jgi:hypothetical protein
VIQNQSLRSSPGSLRHRLIATALAVSVSGGAILGIPSLSNAQNDGTSAATPLPPSTCLVVASAFESPESAATPIADTGATPVASPVASPVVSDNPVTDTTAELLSELQSTTESIFGCLNERNFEVYAQLTSDAYRGHLFGSDQPLPVDQFVELATSLSDSDHRVMDISSIEVLDDTSVRAEVTYVSAYQQRTGIWIFKKQEVDGIQTWMLDSEELIPVETPLGAYVIDVTFEENGYSLDPESADGSDVVLNLNNPTDEDHEALVLRFDDGTSPDALLRSTSASLPDGVTLIGQSTVLAGGQGTMFLTNLTPGTYTIVDLLPDENGNPHLSSGMSATFTVND